MLYTLNLQNVVYQIYFNFLNKAKQQSQSLHRKTKAGFGYKVVFHAMFFLLGERLSIVPIGWQCFETALMWNL